MSNVTNIPLENAYTSSISGSISALATTITVDDAVQFTLPAGQTVDVVVDPENNRRERCVVTAIDATKKILTVTRAQPDYLGHTATAYSHSGGAKIVITDSWSVFNDAATAINSKVDQSTGKITAYATAAARDAAITSPANGMQVYLTDTGKFTDYMGGVWTDREAGGTFANASTTVAGKVEEATEAEIVAGTGTGATGARLFIAPDNAAIIDDSAGVADAGKLAKTDAGGRLKASMVHLDAESLEDDGSDNVSLKMKPLGGLYKDAAGVYAQLPSLESTAYTYGEAISKDDVLYMLETDNRVYKITSSAETWRRIVGVAMENGIAGENKRVLIKGLVDKAFSAIQPTFAAAGGGGSTNLNTGNSDRCRAYRLDNEAGPECVTNGVSTVRIKKTGTPTQPFTVGLALGSSTTPYIGFLQTQNRPYGQILAEASIAQIDIGNVFDDEEFTFTDVVIPANSYVWIYFFTGAASSGVNYYTIETSAVATGAIMNTNAVPCAWTAANVTPNFSLTMASINPWEKQYAVRAYNGTPGGCGIGTNAATLPWNRVIGHVVSATQWYFNPDNNNIDVGNFVISQSSAGSWGFSSVTDMGFRPSFLKVSGGITEAAVGSSGWVGYCNYISNAVVANSMAGTSVTAASALVTVSPSGGVAWAYHVVPLENGFHFSPKTRATGAGTDPWPSANALNMSLEYTASQK